MKKYIGVICSGVASIFMFIFLSVSNLTSTASATIYGQSIKESNSINGWDILKDSSSIKGYDLYKIFTILMIIVAVLLLVSAVLLLLKNLNVLKVDANFEFINKVLLIVFVLCAFISLMGLFVMSADMSGTVSGITLKVSPAIGAWLNIICAIITCILPWVLRSEQVNKNTETNENN